MNLVVSIPADQLDQLVDLVAARLADRLEPPTPTWPEWMSIETASRYLDCSVERLRKLVARNQIPFHQEGPRTRVFFNRFDIDGWMQGRSAS